MIAQTIYRDKNRFYPCPYCRNDHPSTTTCLSVIGSDVLMGWSARMGTAKLKLYDKATMENVGLETLSKIQGRAQELWDAEEKKKGKQSSIWKSGSELSKEATDYGTVAHAAFEMYLLGKEVDKKSLPEPSRNAFEVFEKFASENKIETIDTEKTFYNCALGYAGTADWRGKINGKLTLADWKTSTGIFEKNITQCWCNAIADEMQNGDQLYQQILIGRFGKDGTTDILIVPRNGLENGLGSYEEARELIKGCVNWFNYKQKYDQRFPYRPK